GLVTGRQSRQLTHHLVGRTVADQPAPADQRCRGGSIARRVQHRAADPHQPAAPRTLLRDERELLHLQPSSGIRLCGCGEPRLAPLLHILSEVGGSSTGSHVGRERGRRLEPTPSPTSVAYFIPMEASMNWLVTMSSALRPDFGGKPWAVYTGVALVMRSLTRSRSNLPITPSGPLATRPS